MKKLFSVIICFILVFGMAETAISTDGATASIESVTAKPGDLVTVTITLTNCEPIKSMYIRPKYDNNILEMISGEWLISGMMDDAWSEEFGDASITFNNNEDINGEIFEMKFRIKDSTTVKNAQIELEELSAKSRTETGNEEYVIISVVPGIITIEQTHTHTMTHIPATKPTCTEPGSIEYWYCADCGKYFTDEAGENEITQAETVIPPTGHTPGEAVRENEVPATCTEPGSYDTVVYCTVCGAELSRETVSVPALGHDWGDWTETQAPSCTEAGEEARTCKRDGTHKETREIPPTGHAPGEAVHENEVPATCTEAGIYDEVVYCTACGAELSRDSKTVPAFGHDWSDWTATTEATCTEAGEESRSCKRCGETETRATPPLGHDWGAWTVTKEPTETEPGEESRVCARCGETETRVMTEPEDHDWGDWKLTTKPGCTRSGQETRVCAHCGETETRPVEALGHRWGEWAVTKQPTATETGTETIRCLRCGRTMTRTVPCLTMPFTDVPEDAWYYEAVHKVWAQGLMTGVSDTLFAPGQSCERGMIVTILYRLAGAPEAGTSGFLDVAEGDYYAAAVAWAEAEGIVYGYDETHFFPRTPITRQQLAAMLYRYAAWAGLDVSAADGLTDYADAETVSSYALEAMRWAVAQELLFGTEAQRLEPDAEATRVQTAAALARFTELAD